MAVDRKTPTILTNPGDLTGSAYADAVAEEMAGLWANIGGISVGASGANTITCTLAIPILSYTNNLRVTLIPAANNTGNATIAIDGLAPVAILDPSGNPLVANALVANRRQDLVYSAALSSMVMVGGAAGTGSQLSKVLIAAHQLAAGTAGGAATSGAWNIYPIETSILNDLAGEGVALSGSAAYTFGPVPAGYYDFYATVPFNLTAMSRLRLFNVTDSVAIATLASDTVRANNTNEVKSATLRGRFTINAAKSLRLEYRVSVTRATDGFGTAASFGETEKYGHIMLARPPEGNLGLGSIATRNLTISTLDPSGGVDGDLWMKVVP